MTVPVATSVRLTDRLWLVTVNTEAAVAPSAATVKVSCPPTVGVTSKITTPLPFVIGAEEVPASLASATTVLPAADLKVTGAFVIGLPAESVRV